LSDLRADGIRGIIFDMDGTLFRTQDLIVHCVNETSQKYLKRRLPRQDGLWSFGPPARNVISGLAETLPNRPIHEAIDYYESAYRRRFRDMALAFHGIPELLEELAGSGRSLAVVTSETSTLSDYALETFNLRSYFDALVTSDHVVKRKPDPAGVHLALRKMRLSPQECMLVGDSATDITAGKNAGLLTGAALWGSETWGDPRTANPDFLFSNVQELREFFPTFEKERNVAE
jgi:HAD superfamily hydrolase (TIGR01509 family)